MENIDLIQENSNVTIYREFIFELILSLYKNKCILLDIYVNYFKQKKGQT